MRAREQPNHVGELQVKPGLANALRQGGARWILQNDRADAAWAHGGDHGGDHRAEGMAQDNGGTWHLRVEERDRIRHEISHSIARRHATRFAVPAVVQSKDLPAFGQRGKQRIPILPAARHTVEEHERRTVLRADGAAQGSFACSQRVFMHSLHAQSIAVIAR